MKVTVRFTGLLRLETGRGEEVCEMPAGASLADLVNLLQGRGLDLSGYFLLLERPGEPALSVRPQAAGAETLVDGSRVTLLYRFAGG
ncbi:MAG: hypothetical protein QME87_04035 [Bacillota bacterium]|nr:hypothetical protein [Bacillota bacterium]